MYYYYIKSQTKDLPSPVLSLSPRDIEQIRVDILNEEKYQHIWKLVAPYFVLPSWHKNFDSQLYVEITTVLREYPLFLEKILVWRTERSIEEQLLDLIAFSGLLDIPKNPSFISIQLFLENSLQQIQASSDYKKYCERALELQEHFQLDFGAAASYIDRLIEQDTLFSSDWTFPFFAEEKISLHSSTLQEQALNIDSFLREEGIREIEMSRWRQQLQPSIREWVTAHISSLNYADLPIWSEDEHTLLLTLQAGRIFFQWRGAQSLFELWLDEQELLLLPIMEDWQKREWQYWELPSRPGALLQFRWNNQPQKLRLLV